MASSSRSTSRASSKARDEVIALLKDDHKRVKKAYRDFKKIDAEEDPESCAMLVNQVLDDLTVHAELEEELLYPAARDAIAEEDLIDEAEVEHETMHHLIDQLRGLEPGDEKYAARFTVLCEYVLHHVKEEESEMFPQLARARLDWESLHDEMIQRREELMGEAAEGMEPAGARGDGDAEEGPVESGPTGPGGERGGEKPSAAERDERRNAPLPRH